MTGFTSSYCYLMDIKVETMLFALTVVPVIPYCTTTCCAKHCSVILAHHEAALRHTTVSTQQTIKDTTRVSLVCVTIVL